MPICNICLKEFNPKGYTKHLKCCKARNKYYNNPKICLNPKCDNIIKYKVRNQQSYCCRLCAYTKERRALISQTTKRYLKETPEIFKNFGKINSVCIKYKNKYGKIINLQSSYELRVAKQLDKYNISWIRPSFLSYIDSIGNNRKYYPDFYLMDFDVYLDPKNDWLIQNDSDKIRRACKQNQVKVFILGETQLEWKIIKNIIKTDGL